MSEEQLANIMAVEAAKTKIYKVVEEVPGVHLLKGGRNITVSYGDLELVDVRVASLTAEVAIRLSAAM
eukprot:6717746-Lingulodinium_polyedra.AAC.1